MEKARSDIRRKLSTFVSSVYPMSHSVMRETGVLGLFGLYAVGEMNSYKISPIYTTIDVEGADKTLIFGKDGAKLPLSDSSARVIYMSHVLEHLQESSADQFFQDAFRALKPGGELLIEVPDANVLYEVYKSGRWEEPNTEVKVATRGRSKSFHESFLFPESAKVSIARVYTKESAELVNEPHSTFVGTLSCFLDPPYKGSHLPAITTRGEVDAAVQDLDRNAFFDWCVNLQSEEQKNSGGHCSAWYPEKLLSRLEDSGFDAKERGLRETRTLNLPFPSWICVPDRSHRSYYSFRVSAVKPKDSK